MLKIVHLLTGAIALLLSFIPTLRADAIPYLQNADAVYLALLGLTSLLLTPTSSKTQQVQSLVSALIVLAVVLQILILLAPLPAIGDQPAILLPLLILAVAAALHLVGKLNKSQPQAAQQPQASAEDRETGTVKWFNTSKGFGFISRDSGEDIFVHFRAIRGEGHRILIEGQRVEFSVVQRDKGLQAEDVIAALPGRR
jgi:CspA family cold shock protein